MKNENVLYLRISDPNSQDEQSQIKVICKKYGLVKSDCLILAEQITAWNQDKENKRAEFLKLKHLVKFKKCKNIYVFDIDRIYRNRSKLVDFYNYCKFYGVNIYSHNQDYLNKLVNIEMPAGLEFMAEQIFNNTLNLIGWMGEDESNKKSQRVKAKVTHTKKGVYSVYGKKWGRKRLSKQTITKIIGLRSEKCTLREIAGLLNISKSVVHKTIHEFSDKKS